MDWLSQLYVSVSPYFHDYGVAISSSLLFLIIGWWIGRQRARARWQKRLFFNRLNVSLNIIRKDKLMIRTILEDALKDVFINKAAADIVVKSAKKNNSGRPDYSAA